jgi:hypothetical protein
MLRRGALHAATPRQAYRFSVATGPLEWWRALQSELKTRFLQACSSPCLRVGACVCLRAHVCMSACVCTRSRVYVCVHVRARVSVCGHALLARTSHFRVHARAFVPRRSRGQNAKSASLPPTEMIDIAEHILMRDVLQVPAVRASRALHACVRLTARNSFHAALQTPQSIYLQVQLGR